eukprot:2403771-Amphidinium_carterae.2
MEALAQSDWNPRDCICLKSGNMSYQKNNISCLFLLGLKKGLDWSFTIELEFNQPVTPLPLQTLPHSHHEENAVRVEFWSEFV